MKNKYLLFRPYYGGFAGLALLLFASTSQAQLKDCNAFIRGNHLEVGVNYSGAYGSSTDAPTGYHPRTLTGSTVIQNHVSCISSGISNLLGFVADPAKDGWTTATGGAADYYGDYFIPGYPQEGWSIMTEKLEQTNCWNGTDVGTYAPGIAGVNTRYVVSGSRVATEWEGIYDSLHIIQRTILDTANTYFVIRVKIKNLAHRPRKNVYYLRTVDPDNDVTLLPNNFITDNRIPHQNPAPDSLSIVTATGCTYPDAYVGLGAKDLRARCFITGPGAVNTLRPAHRIDSLFDGSGPEALYNAGDSLMGQDVAIGLVFRIDSLPAYDSTLLKMAYMFGGPKELGAAMDDDGLLPEERMPTGIRTPVLHTRVSINPNPFDQVLQLEGTLPTDRISICDFQGTTIACDIQANGNGHLLNTSFLATGIYILTVTDAQGQVQHRQLIQHR